MVIGESHPAAEATGDLYPLRRLGGRPLESEASRKRRERFDFLLGAGFTLIGAVAVLVAWMLG